MDFPAAAHQAEIHSINPLERVNGEVKRRADAIGIFPDEPPSRAWSSQLRVVVGSRNPSRAERPTVGSARPH
jgi:transposase-like protein